MLRIPDSTTSGEDLNSINDLEFSYKNIQLLMNIFKKYRNKLDMFLEKKINSTTINISEQYIPLALLLSDALKNKEGFEKYKEALIKLIKDIELFIAENSNQITEATYYGKKSVDNIIK